MKKKKGLRVLLCAAIAVAVLLAAFLIYAGSYYHADEMALAVLDAPGVTQTDGTIVLTPEGACDTGLVFYPGGKVQAEAYLPLLQRLQKAGIQCVLVKMPLRFAFFNANAASTVIARYPNIQHWYVGGHSLGGAMASSWAAKHPDDFDGLVLLGAYVYGDVPAEKSLVLYGTEDGVLSRDKLSGGPNEQVIPGGNHAQFGNYGAQKGDRTATITSAAQQDAAVARILNFIHAKK